MRISDWSSDVCSSDLPGLVLQGGEEGGQRLGALGPEPGHGLVEQQQLRPQRERQGDLEQAPLAVGQRAHRVVGPQGEADAVEDAEGSRAQPLRSEEHTSELPSLMRNSYAVFCLKKKTNTTKNTTTNKI